MAYKRLFIDSDVLLDMLLNRDPFCYYVQALLAESEKRNLEICTSTLAIANINYIITKKIGSAEARKKVKELINSIKILPFESKSIELAIDSRFSDLEDAFQHFISKKHDCNIIITRNIKDYKQSEIPAHTAEDFLRKIL
jgi:predicted nucleic acid-binding protein